MSSIHIPDGINGSDEMIIESPTVRLMYNNQLLDVTAKQWEFIQQKIHDYKISYSWHSGAIISDYAPLTSGQQFTLHVVVDVSPHTLEDMHKIIALMDIPTNLDEALTKGVE